MKTDITRWEALSKSTTPPTWGGRNEIIKQFVPEHSSVLDIGAGNQHLKTLIPETCSYQPVDCVPGDNVIVIDFNKENASDVILGSYDIAVCSGVLEYIRDAEAFFKFVFNNTRMVIFTYVFAEARIPSDTELSGWDSGISKSEFEELMEGMGAQIEYVSTFKRHTIMLLRKR